MSDQKRKRRSNVKHPALHKRYNPKVRQEYIDYDYLDKLNPEELDWLNKFSEEYINARFQGDETDIDKSPEGRKAAYDRNNARNRCLYSQLKVRRMNDKLLNYDDVVNIVEETQELPPSYIEDAYLDYMDEQFLVDAIQEYDMAMKQFTETDE